MFRSEMETWVASGPGPRPLPEDNIVLLPNDPYANNTNETLPFRSTTYDAKYVASTPFQSGSVYLQDPDQRPTTCFSSATAVMEELNLPTLYTIGYRAYLKQQREKEQLRVSLPSAPPDFDGSTPTNPESVAQHVHGLAKAYNSVAADPTPYEMRRHMLLEAANEFAALNVNINTNQQMQQQLNGGEMNSLAYLGVDNAERATAAAESQGLHASSFPSSSSQWRSAVAGRDTSGKERGASDADAATTELVECPMEEDDEDDLEDADEALSGHYAPNAVATNAFSLSMSLAALPVQSSKVVVETLRLRLQTDPRVPPLLSGRVVSVVLSHCAEHTAAGGKSLASKCELLSLVGVVVATRGRIREILRYLAILESFHKVSADILPARVPAARAIVQAFTLHTQSLCPVTSPIDCHQDEPRPLRVTLSEGTATQCFSVSPDGRLLAVVHLRGITLYETASGAILANKDFAEWNDPNNSNSNSLDSSSSSSTTTTTPTTLDSLVARVSPSGVVPSAETAATAADGEPSLAFGLAAHAGGQSVALQSITFTEDSSHLMATHAGGTRHWVFTSDLSVREEHSTGTFAFPLRYRDGELQTQPLPFLPVGCTTHALLHTQQTTPLFALKDKVAVEPAEELILCAHIGTDYDGFLARLATETDELTVKVASGVITLAQSDIACVGNVCCDAHWLFVQVRWTRGVWTLEVNGRLVELRGLRSGQTKAVLVKAMEGLQGRGHAASFSLWTGVGDSPTAVRTFARERRLEAGVRALVNLPLDEGMGLWIKETVSATCVTLPETEVVWDDAIQTPCHKVPGAGGERSGERRLYPSRIHSLAPAATTTVPGSGAAGDPDSQPPRAGTCSEGGSGVRLDGKLVVGGQVMSSIYKTYILMPPSTKGGDDTVAEVDRATNTIVRVYRCPKACSENLYSVRWDESELVVFQPRFSTFTSSRLYTDGFRENELMTDSEGAGAGGGQGCTTPAVAAVTTTEGEQEESVPWLLHQLYKKLYLSSDALYRIPAESSPITMANLRHLTQQMSCLGTAPGRLRVTALLSLTLAHFQKLNSADEKELSQIAASLKAACAKVLAMLSDSRLIHRLATTLMHAATRKSLTLQDKVNALLDADTQRIAAVLQDCTTKESFFALIQHVIAHHADRLLGIAQCLFTLCRSEEEEAAARQQEQRQAFSSSRTAQSSPENASTHAAASLSSTHNSHRGGDLIAEASSAAAMRQQLPPTSPSGSVDHGATDSNGGTPSITRLMVWFVLASVTVLRSYGRLDVVSQLLELCTEYMATSLADAARAGSGKTATTDQATPPPVRVAPQYTAVHTGCLPLFTVVAEFCPEAVTPAAEEAMLRLLEQVRGANGCAMESEGDAQRLRTTPVTFVTREACDVYPNDREPSERMWRLRLDFSRATSVSVQKEASTAPLYFMRSDRERQAAPTVVEMTADRLFAKVRGGQLFFHGTRENTFTVVAQFELTVDGSWTAMARDSLTHILLSHVAQLTRRSNAGEAYIPSFMRNGLNSQALRRHGIEVPGREQTSRLADGILAETGGGREYVSQVLQSMRGSIVPSMRPAVQALLAILVHGGATLSQAEDELKLRWFSGEWGSKLQGPTRDTTRAFLHDLAAWVTTSLAYHPDTPGGPGSGVSLSTQRCLSLDRRHDVSMNGSRSLSERRGSTSSRRSMLKTAQHAETLDQVRTLLSKDVATDALEGILAERTHAAMKMTRGLSVLLHLLSHSPTPHSGTGAATSSNTTTTNPQQQPSASATPQTDSAPSEALLLRVLEVVWSFANVESGGHFLDSLSGAGVDLEAKVRSRFHEVLARCEELLLGACPKTVAPQAVLSETATNGRATMILLAILCHPWDVVDCECFMATFGKENDLLQRLEDQMNIPTCTLTLTNPWRLRRGNKTDMSSSEERALRSELLGAADMNSLSRIFPNNFSVVIPQLETSRSEGGVILEKHSSAAVVVRADEGWPLTWRDGVPRIFYFEAKACSAGSNVEVGLLLPKGDRGLSTELNLFYRSTGQTHSVQLPAFGFDDTVGCGVIATSRRLFFTLNGTFISFLGGGLDKSDVVFPAIRLDERPGAKVVVNFGTTPFAFDFRQLHPALNLVDGPTWYRVASTAEIALHYVTTRACAIQESRKPSAKVMLSHTCEVVCRNVNRVTTSLMNTCLEGNLISTDSGTRIKQAVIFAVTEYSLTMLIATMRQIVNAGAAHTPLPDVVGEMIFDAASVLMLLPLHSIQMSTIGILPEVIPHVRRTAEGTAPDGLVRALFEHANGATGADTKDLIPFVPTWRECDARCMSIANVQYAYMIPEAQRSIVLGNPLPRTGTVSFTVKISRRGMSKGHSLKGGYFIGVSVAGLSPLSPTSNSQSWKAVKPPVVWALHDTSPQLPHATNPTVRPNSFQRTFGNDDAIRVVVDCDRHTIDFYRDGEFLKTLFSAVPADGELVPFVQLYNDDAAAQIFPGEMSAPISASTLLSASSVDVLRSMLTLEPFEELVGLGVSRELDTCPHPKVALALFNSVPDPRVLQLQSGGAGDGSYITVSRVSDMRCKFSTGNEANYEHIFNLRAPANARISCSFESAVPVMSLRGLRMCVDKLADALRRLVLPLVTLKALSCLEEEKRQSIIDEEKDRWDFLFHGLRVSSYVNIQKFSQSRSLLTVPRIPVDFTFSAALSHPNFAISPNYCGRLATVPNGARNATPPFIAVAEPSVPVSGKFSIRCQLIRGHNGQILGGGYYFGVCTESFNWRRKDLNSATPEVWAFHDMDDAPWRLRHMHPGAVFQITADPHCIIVSGDVIRLEIDRDEGTMHVFRKPMSGEEIPLGLAFDKIPSDVRLYPFVHLFNVDAVAVLLPTNSSDPAVRLTTQQPHFATWPTNERRYCDGCAAAHSESKLTQRWYKCNECADYALCKSCFDLCVHSYHAFTEMGVPFFAHSTLPPLRVRPGMKVVLPGTCCVYLRSSGCRMHEDQINCVADAIEDNALAIWGMVYKQKGQFTVHVDTTNGEPLSTEHPMFIGVGAAEEVMQLSREKLRGKCYSPSSSIVAFSSDSTMRRKMDCESRHPYGFERGATITVEVDVVKRMVSFMRDWIVVGTRPLELTAAAASMQYPVCCFVMFGKKDARISVFPERGSTVLAKVEELSSNFMRVASLVDGRTRYAPSDDCRLPLCPATKETAQPGRLGYTYLDRQLTQCRVTSAEKDELRVHCLQGEEERVIPVGHFLVDEEGLLAEERLIHKEGGAQGSTLESGFVISRLLLILSCLCENETMCSLVMAHYADLARMLRSLSSVHIGNEAPLDFLEEIRGFIAATAGSVRGDKGELRLNPFVPTLIVDDRKRKFKPGMLAREIARRDAASGMATVAAASPVFRVRSRKGEMLHVENIETREKMDVSFKHSIPVKQSGHRPWFTLPNGLPCSLLEHTIRVSDPELPPKNISIDGDWQGEMTFAKTHGIAVELSLTTREVDVMTTVAAMGSPSSSSVPAAGVTGAAAARIRGGGGGSSAAVEYKNVMVRFTVMFEHSRYGRTVRMCLVPAANTSLVDRMVALQADEAIPFPEKVAKLFLSAPMSSSRDRMYAIDAEVDADGLRMNGTCRTNDGKMGAITANWTSRVSFAPLTTEVFDIEPLPDCADAVIPAPPPRDLCATMHRLVVLLARHLYLVICNKLQSVSKDFVEHIFLFHTHPLTERLASQLVGPPHLYFMVSEACQLILDPAVRPWDAASLSSLVTKTLLLRPETVSSAPDSLLWDTLHAVVVAAHRCGCYYRHQILRDIARFVVSQPHAPQIIYTQLFAALFSFVDRNTLIVGDATDACKDVSAGVDLILTVKGPLGKAVCNVPIKPLSCLVDIWHALSEGGKLPAVVDSSVNCRQPRSEDAEEDVFAKGVFGNFRDDELRVGKVMSSCAAGPRGRYYYEVVLPDRLSAPYAVGWGTEAHGDVPSQHVGSDRASFSFNGADVNTKEQKEEYKVASEIFPGSVVGCLLDMETRTVAWSVNGARGAFVSLPISLSEGEELFAFASIGTCNGMRVRLRAEQFEYVPDGFTDLAHRYTRVLVDGYDASKRSTLPPQTAKFYAQLASYLSDLEEAADEGLSAPRRAASYATTTPHHPNASASLSSATPTASRGGTGVLGGSATAAAFAAVLQDLVRATVPAHGAPTTLPSRRYVQASEPTTPGTPPPSPSTRQHRPSTANANASTTSLATMAAAAAASLSVGNIAVSAETLFLPKYHYLNGVSRAELDGHIRVIATVESCMATASRFVDLDGDTISGALSTAFVFLKPLVRRTFRQKLLVNIPGVEKVATPPTIAIRVTELYSTLPRTPEVALQHTVLSQLYKQIGFYSEAQWALSPLFRVNLYISESGHAPVDMGGPYRQVWTFLAEEIMRHPDKCFPHSDFHRNPLFIFVNNSQRVSLVPDGQASTSYDLALFNFFGKIMGHAARAKFPLDIDFSPFLWKFLVDDALSVEDYYQHVDSVVATSMGDDAFLLSGIAEEIIPGFADKILWAEGAEDVEDSVLAQRRRVLAESCLVHSMDEQLGAIRSGLWSVLPRRVVRCLSWRDLEKLVCGETNPSLDDLKRYIRSQLSYVRDKFFWQIVEGMTAEQKASLLCFASGQRRLPLIRSITIQENNESLDHLPRAQSCSSLITVPAYTSLEVFREKLFIALQHQSEMELA